MNRAAIPMPPIAQIGQKYPRPESAQIPMRMIDTMAQVPRYRTKARCEAMRFSAAFRRSASFAGACSSGVLMRKRLVNLQ